MRLRKNKTAMQKINQNLNVFDADRHELDSVLASDMNSLHNGSAQKQDPKRHSRSQFKKHKEPVPKSKYRLILSKQFYLMFLMQTNPMSQGITSCTNMLRKLSINCPKKG